MISWLRSIAVLCALTTSPPALAYDASWYKSVGFSGEYPHGFTMAADATIAIRPMPDPDAERSVKCLLRKNATYHPWNESRVASDGLEFISFSKIEDYTFTGDYQADLSRETDGTDAVIAFKKGDRWSYLAYGAEGDFLMRFKGVDYNAGQDLFDHSKAVDPAAEAEDNVDEWIKLKCANQATGWLLLDDVPEDPAFASPNITGYGHADDGPASE